MNSKTINAMKKLNFMENFAGILVHDHETTLYHFGTDHAECNVRLIRYLKKNTEETKHTWSDQMISLLYEANKSRKGLFEQGFSCFSNEVISGYEKKYMELIVLGLKENKATQHKIVNML